MGGRVGPGVFEVTTSLMEMNDYHFYKATLEIVYPESIFEFDNADEYVFTYCRDAQEYLNVIVNADNIGSVGAKMQLLCGLLERLAPRYEKEASVLEEINLLVDHIDKSGISDSRKEQLCNYIKAARWESSRRRCNDLCKRYAKKKYGKYNTKRIVNEAYSIRSAYAHGKIIDAYNKEAAPYIKYVVLDVLMNYFREKEMNKELD